MEVVGSLMESVILCRLVLEGGSEYCKWCCSRKKEGGKRPLAVESFYAWFTETQQKNLSEGFFDVVAGIINENL
ncbi:unnamed protein product [Musa hybrid cultivar]